tara:strand:+ start:261 stop:1019 length:759 start_codon:yes stop_codon:yes gene_type:complete
MQKASIIIPYYKKKTYIKKTINSVLNQTYKRIEVIIIYDDEDKSDLPLIKEIKNLDKRIKLIINKKNLGAGASRNIGISKSTGEYLCFIDADDYWKKNKLSLQIKFMKKNDYMITHTSYIIQNDKKKFLGQRRAKTFSNLSQLLPSCDIGLSTVVIKKKIFKDKFIRFPNIKTKEDFVLWLYILKKNFYINSLDKTLTKWTKSDDSLSSSTLQKLKDSYLVYNKYMKFNFIKSLYFTILLSINYLIKNFKNK